MKNTTNTDNPTELKPDEPENSPHPRNEERTITIDPPTEYVLIPILERLLVEGELEEVHQKAAVARLLSTLEGHGTTEGELTNDVSEHTVLDGAPGMIYQEALFEYYNKMFDVDP